MITKSTTALAYMAGLIDGEGTICLSRRNDGSNGRPGHYTCRLAIVNTDKRMIDWIERHFGQNTYGQPKRKERAHHNTVYVFEARTSEAEAILRAVLPYLVIKREQAELFFKMRETYTGGLNGGIPAHMLDRRQSIVDQMSRLNRTRGQQ